MGEDMEASVESVRLRLRLKLKLKQRLRLRLKLKQKLRLKLKLKLKLMLRLRLKLWLMLRLMLQLSLSTDTKNYRFEELLFEYIPLFPEPHLLRSLQVNHTKSLEPIRICAFTVLIRTNIYLKYIDTYSFVIEIKL